MERGGFSRMAQRKIVINRGIGGFSLSDAAMKRLYKLAKEHEDEALIKEIEADKESMAQMVKDIGIECEENKIYYGYISGLSKGREHPLVVQVVEEMGERANGSAATLQVVSIPEDVEYTIEENDMGYEWVAEKHRRWFE